MDALQENPYTFVSITLVCVDVSST